MYKVFFAGKFVNKQRCNLPNKNDNVYDNENDSVYKILAGLEPGTEINVHTEEQTHYNATFLAFDHKNKKVSLLTDRFYKQSNHLTILDCNDITSIDLPVASNDEETVDSEDE